MVLLLAAIASQGIASSLYRQRPFCSFHSSKRSRSSAVGSIPSSSRSCSRRRSFSLFRFSMPRAISSRSSAPLPMSRASST
jgi:hypothetical protein